MGPIHAVQFVIEMAGPRTVAATSVKALLNPQWFNLLGHPEIFVMSGADASWRKLEQNDPSGSYDSIALAWNLFGLNPQIAQQLWNHCDDFAKQIGRRAFAMPVPDDLLAAERGLEEMKESLDIGVNLMVVPAMQPFAEGDIWQVAAALGLDLEGNGVFVWRAPNADHPLLEVSSLDEPGRFSLAQVQAGSTHSGLLLGFSVPHSPDPSFGLEGALKAGAVFAQRLQGRLLDEEERPVTDASKKAMRDQMAAAVRALTSAGFPPGSVAAAKLFT